MIRWYGKSTNGNWRRKEEANNFIELYELCVDNGTINISDSDPWNDLIIEKSGKTYQEFKNEDEEIIFEKLEGFLLSDEAYNPTDKDIWQLIKNEVGNAYYQTFEFETEDGFVEIDENNFDKNGKLINLLID